jgi:hypothetical protein
VAAWYPWAWGWRNFTEFALTGNSESEVSMKFGVLLLGLAAAGFLGGCTQRAGDMVTLSETQGEYNNRISRSVIETVRQIPDDWAMIWLIDKPIRLSEQSIPSH